MPLAALAALVLLSPSPILPAASPVAGSPSGAVRPASRRELGAFMLGQYARNVEAKLGKAPRTGVDEQDGETLWHYDLAPEQKTVLTFSVTTSETSRVSLIEVTGAPLKGAPELHGVALGATKAEVLQKLGPPDTSEPDDDGVGESLDWEDRNYFVELDASGRVDRIQIVDNSDGYPKAEGNKPDLEGFRKALESRDRGEILEWLCADIDVYTKTDETVNFEGSPREDLQNEESLVARYVYGGTGSIRDLLTSALVASSELEEDEGDWLSTFPEESPIEAIRWTFEAGRWRVWEIFYREDD